MYVSFDDGENWQSLQLNLPVVPITDLAIHKREKDLVAATQGRAFWVLDDLPLLYQLGDAAKAGDYLFKPEDAYRMPGGGFGGGGRGGGALGQNPPGGAGIYYYLKNKPVGEVTLEFTDASGRSIKKIASRVSEGQGPAAPPASEEEGFFGGGGGARRAPAEAGLNRFIWDLRYPDATRFPGLIMWAGNTTGPRVAPGSYQVKLTVDGKTMTQSFEVKKDPRLETTQADFAKQLDLLLKIRDKFSETSDAILQIRDARKQIDDISNRLKDQPSGKAIADAAKSLKAKLAAIEEALYQTKNQSSQDPLNYPIRLNNKLAALNGVVGSADSAPTDQTYAVYEEVVGRINAELQKLDQTMRTDLPAFNKMVREQDIPAVIVKPKASEK